MVGIMSLTKPVTGAGKDSGVCEWFLVRACSLLMSILITVLFPAPAEWSLLAVGKLGSMERSNSAVTRLADERYYVWEALRVLSRLALAHDVDEPVGAVQKRSACPLHDAEPRRADVRYVQALLLLGRSVVTKDLRQPAHNLDIDLFMGPPVDAHGSGPMWSLLVPAVVTKGIVSALHAVPGLHLETTLATRLLARGAVGAHRERGGRRVWG